MAQLIRHCQIGGGMIFCNARYRHDFMQDYTL